MYGSWIAAVEGMVLVGAKRAPNLGPERLFVEVFN